MSRNRNRLKGPRETLGGTPAGVPSAGGELANPLPSALDGRPYVIRDSGSPTGRAYVSRPSSGMGAGEMRVPLGPTLRERRVRLHEMAHVRWTPATAANSLPAGVSWETLNAVEDGRIHKRLRETGFSDALDAPLFEDADWQKWADSMEASADPDNPQNDWTPLEVARMQVASMGTCEELKYRRFVKHYGVNDWVLPVVDALAKEHLGKRRPAFKRTVEFAAALDALFGDVDEIITDDFRARAPMYRDKPTRTPAWGEMTVKRMPLTERLPQRLRQRVKRATDVGCIPRSWHRLPLDGRVFGQKRYIPGGGTVLMDQSGSMGLDMDEIMALIAKYPAVTIATYAGQGDSGELRIIAQGGMRATDRDCRHPYGGNIIDGPALDWLNEMPAPRIWISDGLVTGKGDGGCSPTLLLDAQRKVMAGRVQRVDRMGELLEGGGDTA